uniref:NADH-ubiquinone oxidoreductase chain 2 n=1 Tax=Dichotomius schiffleri TaxID=1534479 RepID=A0A3G1IAV6_9SCAR|nr:NADH dehydrogenase subunit 2 [Dichotomius schiffleri]ARU81299.1 NADH dehydrogenase subunit 2 [Dichotomius schiffleri]
MYKLTFLFSLMIGTLISISSYTWLGMWLGLEINLLSIIPLMSSTENSMASEAALKYFISQTLASTLLLFSIIMMSLNFMYNINMNFCYLLILNTALFTKMGAAPFHFWFPEVIEGLNWMNTFIMLTWQKIAPMILIMYTNLTFLYMSFIIIISSLISGIMGINQISLRKIMTYSSINHIAWMLSAILYNEMIWLYYFIIYSIISLNIIIIFKMLNIYYMKQLFISINNQPMIKFFFIMNFLSLGGLPPFLGFLPKWLTIQTLILNNYYFISIIIIISTLMTLYFYMRITLSTLTLSMNELMYYKSQNINFNIIYILNLISILSLLFITILFNFF